MNPFGCNLTIHRIPGALVTQLTYTRYTEEELDAFRATGDDGHADLAERLNAACDLAEGIPAPPPKRLPREHEDFFMARCRRIR